MTKVFGVLCLAILACMLLSIVGVIVVGIVRERLWLEAALGVGLVAVVFGALMGIDTLVKWFDS